MERFVRAATQTDASLEAARSRKAIRATVRDQGWIDALVENGASPVTRPFIGGLVKVYVFDLPDSMMAVMRSDLDKLEMTEEELDAAGMANLDEAAHSFPHEPVEPGSPIQVLSAGDDYESARLSRIEPSCPTRSSSRLSASRSMASLLDMFGSC
jgi:uncharacterized protein YtpQ (UPF0354 family)